MESFTDLNAWQSGMDLIEQIYILKRKFPKEELYALTMQLQKACVSILANMAEGFSRETNDDKAHKYVIARGECSEVKALLLIAVRVGYISDEEVRKALELSETTGRLLSGLIQRFHSKP